MKQEEFFKDLKVVELASVLAGPAVGMFFAELGAQVTKVENKRTGGDVTRRWKLPTEDKDAPISAYYASVNYRKEVIFADLREEDDKKRVTELIKNADVVISNFLPAAAAKLGFTATDLRNLNPRLIVAELTGYGTHDPRPAFDVVLQAEAGFLYMTGEPGGNPVKMPVALIDLLAAHQMKEGILLALLRRERTGAGGTVAVSLLESALASLANQATNRLMGGHIPQPMGTLHPNIAPYGDIFRCADEKALITAVGTEKQFAGMCAVLEVPELAADQRFSVNAERVKNRHLLKKILTPHFKTKTRDTWLHLLARKGVPAGGIRNMAEVFEDEKAKAMILEEWQGNVLTRRVRTVVFGLR